MIRSCGRIAPYKYPSKRSLTAGMMYLCLSGHRLRLNIRRTSMGTAMKSHSLSKTISEQTQSSNWVSVVGSSLTIVKVGAASITSNRHRREAQPKKTTTITFKPRKTVWYKALTTIRSLRMQPSYDSQIIHRTKINSWRLCRPSHLR